MSSEFLLLLGLHMTERSPPGTTQSREGFCSPKEGRGPPLRAGRSLQDRVSLVHGRRRSRAPGPGWAQEFCPSWQPRESFPLEALEVLGVPRVQRSALSDSLVLLPQSLSKLGQVSLFFVASVSTCSHQHCCVTHQHQNECIRQPFNYEHGFCGSEIWTGHRGDSLSVLHQAWGLGWGL